MYDLDKSQLGRLKKDYLVNIILNLREEINKLKEELKDIKTTEELERKY